MKIIEPDVKLIDQSDDIIGHVTRCARVCYKRESGNDGALYNSLLNKHHWSMFRHYTYYYIVPDDKAPEWLKNYFGAICFGANIIGIDIKYIKGIYYIVTNANWNLDHTNLTIDIVNYKIEPKEFANFSITSWNMMRYTFKVTTQISTSRELNRVSPNNIAEQSTRYVYEDGTLCRPHWMTEEEADYLNTKEILDDDWIVNHCWAKRYIWTIDNSFDKYKMLVDYSKMPRQDARGVLPLDTATNVIYTYSVREWRHIIDLRADEKHAHPNAVIIATAIKCELEQLGYEF